MIMDMRRKIISATLILFFIYLPLLFVFDALLVVANIFPPKYWYGNGLIGIGYPANSKSNIFCEDYPGGRFEQITNSYGFKELDEPAIPFPGIRVLFLGDSHMNGICSNGETIPDQFELLANKKSHVPIDAQNGAFGGLSPAQYAKVLEHMGLALKPDIVVIGLYMGNDFFDLWRKDDRPWARVNDGHLVWGDPEWVVAKDPEFKNSLRAQSRLYWLFYQTFFRSLGYTYSRVEYLYDSAPNEANLFTVWSFLNDIRKGSKYGKNWWNQLLTQHLYFRMFNKINETDVLMRHIVKLYKEICSKNSIRLVIAPIPTAFEIYPATLRPRYEAIQGEIGMLGSFDGVLSFLDERYKQLETVCHEEGIEFYDLRIPLREKASNKLLYFPNDFHINPEGNFIVATFLMDKLVEDSLTFSPEP